MNIVYKMIHTMKTYKNWLVFAMAGASLSMAFTSCEDEPNKFELTGGKPEISYIRPQDVNLKDSLLTSANMQASLAIIGNNLTSIKEMWFNDIKATLNTSYITNHALLVNVPKNVPKKVTDKIYMVTRDADTVTYDFHVIVPPASVSSMSNEYAAIGSEASLMGLYYVDDPNDPLTITFTGINNSTNIPVTQIKSITETEVKFIVPEGATEGQIEVHTIYGNSKSAFYYFDKRNILTDFDGPESGNHRSGSTTGIVPQGWNISATYSDQDGVDGYYCQIGDGKAKTEGGWTEEFKLPFWCGDWKGDPMSIQSGAGVPVRNVIDMSNWENMSVKFEMCIPKANPWSAGALMVLFVNNKQCANDGWQNNIYIQKSSEKTTADAKAKKDELKDNYPWFSLDLDLPRGFYNPWAATGSYDTGDKWITVTMPLSEFVYNMDGTKTSNKMSIDSFDSFVIWPFEGGVTGKECTPIFRFDNIRIVPNL